MAERFDTFCRRVGLGVLVMAGVFGLGFYVYGVTTLLGTEVEAPAPVTTTPTFIYCYETATTWVCSPDKPTTSPDDGIVRLQ